MKEEFMQDMFIRMSDDNNYEMLSEHSEAVAMQEQESCEIEEYDKHILNEIAAERHYAELDEQEQLITNQNNLKMKKVEEAVEVKETKEETLKRLFLAHGLVKEDVYKDKRGFVIITRTGIDKIVSSMNIQVAYEPVTMTQEWVVIRATASMRTGSGEHDVRNMMSFGEASDDNLMGGAKKFPVAMAEKRAMSRVVLKIAGFYEQGVFGQDELAD